MLLFQFRSLHSCPLGFACTGGGWKRGRRWLGCVPGQCCSLCHLKGLWGTAAQEGSVALRAHVRLYWCHVPLALVVMPAALPWNFCNISGSWSDCSPVVYFFPARVRFLSSLSILSWFPMLSHEPAGGICLQCAWFWISLNSCRDLFLVRETVL